MKGVDLLKENPLNSCDFGLQVSGRCYAPVGSILQTEPPPLVRVESDSRYNREEKRRGVAQPGSASALGAEGREFESLRPDQ
jgi:hypothetical protein